MSKSFSLDYVLGLPEDDIRSRFPHGLVMEGKRWIAAEHDSEGIGHRSLRQLVAEKRKRVLKPRLLDKNPGMSRSDYTDRLDRAMRDEGEAPPKPVTDRYSDEATARALLNDPDRCRDEQAKVLANKLAKLQREGAKLGVDVVPRVQALIAEAQGEIVDKRKKAA